MKDITFKSCSFSREELKGIASLHHRWISSGFLASLGVDFLVRLYASITECPEGILMAAEDSSGKVIGFISGTTSIRSVYKHLVKRHFLFLTLLVFRSVFSVKTMKRICESKKYSAQKHSNEQTPLAELLSIVVDERFRGAGVSQGLMKQLRQMFSEKGVRQFKIVVGSQLFQAQKFYAKEGAVKIEEIELHQGERSLVYQCSCD